MKVVSALALFSALSFTAAPVFADDLADAAHLQTLLTQAGYQYHTTSDKTVVWIPFTGKNLGEYKVIAASGDNGLEVIFVVVAKKSQMAMTPDLATTMLKLNHTLDRVKVGIDDDGDAFVRLDSSIRVMDQAEIKAEVDQLAAAADEVYGDMKPYLTS